MPLDERRPADLERNCPTPWTRGMLSGREQYREIPGNETNWDTHVDISLLSTGFPGKPSGIDSVLRYKLFFESIERRDVLQRGGKLRAELDD